MSRETMGSSRSQRMTRISLASPVRSLGLEHSDFGVGNKFNLSNVHLSPWCGCSCCRRSGSCPTCWRLPTVSPLHANRHRFPPSSSLLFCSPQVANQAGALARDARNPHGRGKERAKCKSSLRLASSISGACSHRPCSQQPLTATPTGQAQDSPWPASQQNLASRRQLRVCES